VTQTAQIQTKRDPSMFFRRVENQARNCSQCGRIATCNDWLLVAFPLSSLESLSSNGISTEEIYSFIVLGGLCPTGRPTTSH